MSVAALLKNRLSPLMARRWGTKIEVDGRKYDTGVQEFAEDLLRALLSPFPDEINEPLQIINNTDSHAIQIVNQGPDVRHLGLSILDGTSYELTELGIGLGSSGIIANNVIVLPNYGMDAECIAKHYGNLGGGGGTGSLVSGNTARFGKPGTGFTPTGGRGWSLGAPNGAGGGAVGPQSFAYGGIGRDIGSGFSCGNAGSGIPFDYGGQSFVPWGDLVSFLTQFNIDDNDQLIISFGGDQIYLSWSGNTTNTITNINGVLLSDIPAGNMAKIIGIDSSNELVVKGDAGADRILFWDDSESYYNDLTVGSGLEIDDTTLKVAPSSGGGDGTSGLFCTKVTVDATEFTAAATSESINVYTTAAGEVLHGIGMDVTTAYVGTSPTMSIGSDASSTRYFTSVAVDDDSTKDAAGWTAEWTPITASTASIPGQFDKNLGHDDIYCELSDVINVNLITTGQLHLYIWTTVLP